MAFLSQKATNRYSLARDPRNTESREPKYSNDALRVIRHRTGTDVVSPNPFVIHKQKIKHVWLERFTGGDDTYLRPTADNISTLLEWLNWLWFDEQLPAVHGDLTESNIETNINRETGEQEIFVLDFEHVTQIRDLPPDEQDKLIMVDICDLLKTIVHDFEFDMRDFIDTCVYLLQHDRIVSEAEYDWRDVVKVLI